MAAARVKAEELVNAFLKLLQRPKEGPEPGADVLKNAIKAVELLEKIERNESRGH